MGSILIFILIIFQGREQVGGEIVFWDELKLGLN